MRYCLFGALLVLVGSVSASARADVIHEESFENCSGVGYSVLTGTFTGNTDDGLECGTDDGGPFNFTFTFESGNVSGQDGLHFIGLEDIDGVGLTNPNAVVLDAVDISGVTDLSISFLFAAPSATNTRYETTDFMRLQYRVDSADPSGADYVTIGSFRGTGAIGMAEDDDLNGTFTVPVNGLVMQRFTYLLDGRAGQGTVSGSSLQVRAFFSSDGSMEEMAFDDIVVTGTPSAFPTIDFSASSYDVNEDGTAAGTPVTLLRSGDTTSATSIDLTFTSGTATADEDFDSTTLTVNFGAGETSVQVALPVFDDAVDEADEDFTLSLATNGSGAVVGSAFAALITIIDDDTADVSLSKTSVSVDEDGTTDAYSVVLESEPLANVDVDVTVTGGQVLVSTGAGTPSDAISLTFTPASWFMAQTVMVFAIDDTDVEANPHADTIEHTAFSTDSGYDGIAVPDVAVSIADNDTCGDAFCNPTESTVTCPEDCGTQCGDGACNGAETSVNCSQDCGSVCGDGAVNGMEVCDGSELVGETCGSQGFDFGMLACAGDCLTFGTSACATNVCGDSVPFGGEECDDGADNSDTDPDACRTNCTQAGCGDAVIDTGEVCDGASLNGQSCTTRGFVSGTLACSGNCGSFDETSCVANVCGDGIPFGSEECDDGADNSDTEPDACRTDCTEAVCGDGVVDTGEVCDAASLSGQSCATRGFDSGTLGCSSDCASFDTSDCVDATGAGGTAGAAGAGTGAAAGDGGEPNSAGGAPAAGPAGAAEGGSGDEAPGSGAAGGTHEPAAGGFAGNASEPETGGLAGAAGFAGADASPGGPLSDSTCNCRFAGRHSPAGAWLCGLFAFGLALRRKRRGILARPR